jgi:ParB family chromosome partitioning protein
MAKSPSKGWAAVTQATKALASQDQAARANADRDREQTPRGFIALTEVKPRPHGDTRKVDAFHVLELAESISVLGLLEPLVVDRRMQLLAGAHRWEASRLLAVEDPEARAIAWGSLAGIAELKELKDQELLEAIDRVRALAPTTAPAQVPVRVVEFDAAADADRALSIEVAENEKRRDYTKGEVTALAERLKIAGFKVSRGKPKKGERALGPALAVIIGKSERTVRRLLGGDPVDEVAKETDANPAESALKRLLASIAHLEKASGDKSSKKHRSVIEAAIRLKKQIEKALG